MRESGRQLSNSGQPFTTPHRSFGLQQLTIHFSELISRGLRSSGFRAASFGELVCQISEQCDG